MEHNVQQITCYKV